MIGSIIAVSIAVIMASGATAAGEGNTRTFKPHTYAYGSPIGGVTAAAVDASLPGAHPARITSSGTKWTLENDALKTVIAFSNGSIDMTSFYNKRASVEYLAAKGNRYLFKHVVEGHELVANDGGWSLAGSSISDISFYKKTWGKQLIVTIARTVPVPIRIRLVFEVYNGRAGLRYYSYIKNNDSSHNMTVSASDILALDLPNKAHTLYYVPNNTLWSSTTGSLADGRRNCLVRYDTGDGWAINPENNFCTSLEAGQFKGNYDHTFLHINAWSSIDDVRVYSDPLAVQLVLFPNEEVEYFSVNLEVFKGDQWDARVAVSEHLRLRYKFNPTRTISINDWQWFSSGNRTDAYYRNTAVPAVKEAGLDRVNVDDFWNGHGDSFLRDSDQPLTTFTTDLPTLGTWIESQDLKMGLWFQPSGSGTDGFGAWGGGRDMADPAAIALKTDQVENTLIAKYRSYWDQVDCGLFWKNAANTPYSHPSDSVYRKVVNVRNFMNYIQHKYPDFIMQTTCEVDNPSNFGNESVALLHMPDNGIAGLFRRTESHDNVKDMFNAIGMFPLEGMLETYGEDRQDDVWRAKTGWFYEWLLGRHTSIYYNLVSLTPNVRQLCRQFNDWRKNPRIQALLNEVVRPVYNGPNNDNSGPWSWMFVNEAKTGAIVLAVGGANTSTQTFTPRLRWLDKGKTYLVEDITLQDDGTWHYSFKGKASGSALIKSGLAIDLQESPSRGKAFWIQEVGRNPQQVLYADDKIVSYTERWDGKAFTVKATGTPGATGTLVIYKQSVNATEIKTIALDAHGNGQIRSSGDAITPNPIEPPIIAPGCCTFGETIEVTLSAPENAGTAAIRYTLDGTPPTVSSPLYAAPIRLEKTTTLQAVTIVAGVQSPVASATFVGRGAVPPLPQVYISDLKPVRATVGWGEKPLMDRSIQDQPLSVAGNTYAKGIGTHAISEIDYELRPDYHRFVAVAGINDEMRNYTQSSVIFEVWIDGRRAAQSTVMRLGDFFYFNLPILPGSKSLRLIAGDAGDGFTCDHADWASAGFLLQ